MKTILKSLYSLLQGFGQAKAAAHFARIGDYKAAQALYTTK